MISAHEPEAAEHTLTGQPVEGEEEVGLIPETRVINPLDLRPDVFQENLDRRGANWDALMKWIRGSLIKGTDFGSIQIRGRESKPSLWKPGAEKIINKLGITPTWPSLGRYEDRAIDGGKIETIILKCEGLNSSGQVVAEGVGARTVSQDGGDINKAMKMCKKSSLIDMALSLASISEVFTQDLEDMKIGDDPGLKKHSRSAPRFDRTTKLGFGKNAHKIWREVEEGYLRHLAAGDGDPAMFADMELAARLQERTELITKVHKGLDSISGSAASGILDEWLGKTGHKKVEDATIDELTVLLGQLREEYKTERGAHNIQI